MRRYNTKSNRLIDAVKDNVQEHVVTDIQRNEILELEMDAININTNNTLKQLSNNCMKTQEIESE